MGNKIENPRDDNSFSTTQVSMSDYWCPSCRVGFADQDDFDDPESGLPLTDTELPEGSPIDWLSCPRCQGQLNQ